jgi:hypothetical protein
MVSVLTDPAPPVKVRGATVGWDKVPPELLVDIEYQAPMGRTPQPIVQ